MFKLHALARWLRAGSKKPAPLTLHVNDATGERERVNLQALVSNSAIRLEVHNGRKHLVLPSYTLPNDVVMNGLLYPQAEIEASYRGLEGKLAPLGHPTVNGTYVSANTAEAINAHHIGAWNRNVERRGNRIYLEKWVDVEYAANTDGGKRLLDRVGFDSAKGEMGKPKGNVHTSTGIFLNADLTANGVTQDGTQYRGTAKNMVMDHDCILLDQPGAATPDQGVGLLVNNLNVADAVPLHANEVLSATSFGKLQRLLGDAAQAKWGGDDKYAWVEDFDGTTAIIRQGDSTQAVAYSVKDGKVEWADTSTPVKQKTEWAEIPIVNRFLQSLGFNLNSGPEKPVSEKPIESDPEMTKEELAAAFAANNEAIAGMLKPLGDRLTALETNQKALGDTLTANARAAEADKRALVAKKLGQEVADALTGNALDVAHAKLVGTTGLLGGLELNSEAADGYQRTPLAGA